ncbi:MAG: suppressor of fused domain protein [Steroidobacteraceae bacterium]
MDETLLERVWEYRDETLYPALFGSAVRGIFVIPYDLFATKFSQADVDPRWLHYGVLEYAPTSQRASWVYVTSGMSTPWEAEDADSEADSGLGCEFVLESTVQGDRAIRRLWQLMAYQILLCHDRYPGHAPLAAFDRLPLRSPVWDKESNIQTLMLAPLEASRGTQRLESGCFDLVQVVGITEAEAAFARAHDGASLLERLRTEGAYPVTNPARDSVRLEGSRGSSDTVSR